MKNNINQFKGTWALVTGASAGIGFAFSRELARREFNLIMIARRKSLLEQRAKELGTYGVTVKTIDMDLSQPGCVDEIEKITRGLEIDLLVNNAGLYIPGAFCKKTSQEIQALMYLNVTMPTLLTYRFSQKMIQRKRGAIIFVASNSGFQPIPYLADYAASKAYLLSLGESLHLELKKKGIDVVVVAPGLTHTPGTDNIKGIDFSKLPNPFMNTDVVVKAAFEALGKKPSIVIGYRNRFLIFIGQHVLGRKMMLDFTGKAMEKAVSEERL